VAAADSIQLPNMVRALRRSLNIYGLPLLTVGLALLLTLTLQPLMALGISPLFLAAVMISAWYGGLRAGLIATCLAIVCLCYFFIAPIYSIWISELNGATWLALFIVVSTLISSLNEARKRAEASLRLANQELEARVAERTADLSERNKKLEAEIVERKRIAGENETLIRDLQDALTRIKVLSGMLPVCAECKKIRDNKGHWNEFESYISDHSEATFSQSICPECAKVLYPQYPFLGPKSSGK
jgi:K+-sensing histidine kinase KdpD